MPARRKLVVIGGGWAGIAAAVCATECGHRVTLLEMAPRLGGRSRSVDLEGLSLDNGQHILIGAYVETLALLGKVGLDPATAFLRIPLAMTYPDGTGLALTGGPAIPAFVAAVLKQRAWRARDRIALLATCGKWAVRGFACDPGLTVAELTSALPRTVREDLIDPLCVAALNTPSSEASAAVFLRVLRDALFAAPGSSDLLLPRTGLSALLPEPAARWLTERGATLRLAHRAGSLVRQGDGWSVDGESFDGAVVATTPGEAGRLVGASGPEWSARAAALTYEPIVTVYARGQGVRLPAPMLALRANAQAPAQFVFDRGRLGGEAGMLSFVVSGAGCWADRGAEAVARTTLAQAREALGLDLVHVKTLTEKRATFRCTPRIDRPPMRIADSLWAAGDYVEGPYPATLEGAVRSGLAAARAFARERPTTRL